MAEPQHDVAIIGGGPAGSTCGALIRIHNPTVRVVILEKERFPRDHVGESQLPPIQKVLVEMGVWDKVEKAGFPIKIGASYTWGATTEPWEFEFLPLEQVREEPRPARFEGWRTRTAFQVDRARYDQILLDHAESLGCEVRQGARARIIHDGDRVEALELDGGERVTASHYVDASGNAAMLRRAMGVEVDAPTKLQNVAFWDYWEGVSLNEDLFGHGVTRVQVRSVPNGWLWYIPLSETRASVGFVCPASYYKSQKLPPKALYERAIEAEPRVASLLRDAAGGERVQSTTDWSFLARRASGANWSLTGETLGFADPILAAGLTLTHYAARHCAYNLVELFGGDRSDEAWLWDQYERIQFKRVRQHMRFAEYWYSANGCFEDLQGFCKEVARDAGLKLTPAKAFQWLSNGGLDDFPGEAIIGGFSLASIKQVQWRLSGSSSPVEYSINGKNVFKLNLAGATEETFAHLENGRVQRRKAYRRGEFVLPLVGQYEVLVEALKQSSDLARTIEAVTNLYRAGRGAEPSAELINTTISLLEPMMNNYWVTAGVRKHRPALSIQSPKEGQYIYTRPEGEQGSRTDASAQ